MNVAMMRNIGAWLKGAFCANQISQTAGATSEVTGDAIDILGLGSKPLSCKVLVPLKATLGSGFTVAVNGQIQDSANNSDWSDYGSALTGSVVGTGPSGGGAVSGCAEFDVNLSGARQYIRVQLTPVFSRTGTDTGVFQTAVAFGGADELPFDTNV